ncbi:MAG TPA: HEAT repeat domain-containing protein [Anaerolineaceae bacterium]|nr:MAG: hypothetical protein BWX54_00074 [Verrucomicrobia bacterium ADurb.Bin018]HOR77882.1 HEAT repeat domain-containing protein [Anaerolineaceae bacterium]
MKYTGCLFTALVLSITALPGYGHDLSGFVERNGRLYIALDPAISEDVHAAASVATNMSASPHVRAMAIQVLTNNPSAHIDVLRMATRDPSLLCRMNAAEALTGYDPTIAAETAREVLRQLMSSPPARSSEYYNGYRAAILLAQTGDPSGFNFITDRLTHAKYLSEKVSSLDALPEFRLFPEVAASQVVLQFIENTIPVLAQGDPASRQEANILLSRSFLALFRLHAVDAIPQMRTWGTRLPDNLQKELDYIIRRIEANGDLD